ncbi:MULTISPECIES: hypothetical protein [unclassified Nonomuraea]|uniref:nSTAND1 domain-containing NTPase n=1 Tax=unclassified Nonomuraea TaxID=2593643 RepID=UPI0033F93A5D
MTGRGVAWASPRAMLAGLCASSLLPIALAEPGLPAAVAGLQVVGSLGANVLATLINEALSAANARTRSSTGPSAPGAVSGLAGQSMFEEQVRQELAARLETVLEAEDEQADALATMLATLLERIDVATVVVSEVLASGQDRLLEELTAGFAGLGGQMARFGSLLRALAGTVLQIQQTLSRQDAERQLHQSQGQRQIALLLSVHEQLAELVLRLPEMGAAPYRGLDNPMAPSAAWVGLCPYQGLAPFGPAEARVFYGRGLAVARLLTMVATHTGEGPIIVTGASGAGKSSLLHAGLLPQLATTAADSLAATYGTTGWPQITFTPGPRPLQQLAIHLAVRCGADIDQVLGRVSKDRV